MLDIMQNYIRTFIFIVIVSACSGMLRAQKTVSFYAEDSVEIYAKSYIKNPSNPYILLIHKENSSKGEFEEMAYRFLNADYNCLAVDLRVGDDYKFIDNQTVRHLKKNNQQIDAIKKDIDASINYVYKKSHQPILILASSIPATYALAEAKNNPKVKGLICFSPSGVLPSGIDLKAVLEPYDKPILLFTTRAEEQYIQPILESIPKTLLKKEYYSFKPGQKGAGILFVENEQSSKIWMDILMFFKTMRSEVPYFNP
jgi:dienelactone hydrolase